MKTNMLKISILLAGIISGIAGAAELNVTTEFTPDPTNTGHNRFINTTPVSGYCKKYPQYCKDSFSLSTEILVSERIMNEGETDKRFWTYQGLDSNFRVVKLTDTRTGETIDVRFRLNLLSQRYVYPEGGIDFDRAGIYPQEGCRGTIGVGGGKNYEFGWIFPEGVSPCSRRPIIAAGEKIVSMDTLSVGYIMETPNPLRISSGDYTGSVEYSVGNGAQIDFGEGVYSHDRLVINIDARVNHDLSVSHIANGGQAQLQPPGGWGRWQQGGAEPEKLRAGATFRLTASGPFNVWMICEHQDVRGDCVIKNDASGEGVPVSTRLTLPGVINRDTMKLAEDVMLQANAPSLTMYADEYLIQQNSRVNFEVGRAGTRQMLQQPGSTWRGGVTVVFDAHRFEASEAF